MANPSKRKGGEFEREVVNFLQEQGIAAWKVPLSGAMEGYKSDIDCPVKGTNKKLECKRRKRAFATIYKMLGDSYGLCIRDDRTPLLVVLRGTDFAELIK